MSKSRSRRPSTGRGAPPTGERGTAIRTTASRRATRTTLPWSCWTRLSRGSLQRGRRLALRPGRRPAVHSVGYGAQLVTSGPGGKIFHYADIRYVAIGTLNSITPAWLRISQNASTGNGGTCYGDSGGPKFLGASASETTSSPRRRSRATRPAGRRTSTTGSTRPPRGRSSVSSSPFLKALGGRALRKRGPAATHEDDRR